MSQSIRLIAIRDFSNSLFLNEWAVFCMNGHFYFGVIRPIHYFSFLACIFGILFALMDNADKPFGLVIGIFIWQIQTFLCISFFVFSHIILVGKLNGLQNWQKLILSALIASILFSPVSLAIDVYTLNDDTFTLQSIIREWINMAPPSVICWLLINLPWTLGIIKTDFSEKSEINDPEKTLPMPQNDLEELTSEDSTVSSFPKFLSLCGVDKLDALLYIKAELHYLKVVSESRSDLILYNLKDAILELNTYQIGLKDWQTHRSFWVNKNKITGLIKQGREGLLKMGHHESNQVSVSRQHMAKVRAWLAE